MYKQHSPSVLLEPPLSVLSTSLILGPERLSIWPPLPESVLIPFLCIKCLVCSTNSRLTCSKCSCHMALSIFLGSFLQGFNLPFYVSTPSPHQRNEYFFSNSTVSFSPWLHDNFSRTENFPDKFSCLILNSVVSGKWILWALHNTAGLFGSLVWHCGNRMLSQPVQIFSSPNNKTLNLQWRDIATRRQNTRSRSARKVQNTSHSVPK